MFFLGLFSFFQSSKLGCACGEGKCNPLFCDHVSMFDNDNMEARDKSGVPMKGRFPYDDQGRIILEVCTIVISHSVSNSSIESQVWPPWSHPCTHFELLNMIFELFPLTNTPMVCCSIV